MYSGFCSDSHVVQQKATRGQQTPIHLCEAACRLVLVCVGDQGVDVMLSWNSSSALNLRPCCLLQKRRARSFQYSSAVSLFPLCMMSVCQVLKLSVGSDRTPTGKNNQLL